MPPLSQATASGDLYPWSRSLSLPANQTLGHLVRLPTALQLTLQPFERTFGLTHPARKWWKPSCPSNSPCWDALFGAEPPRLPPVQSIPPPNTFPHCRRGSRATPGPRAAHPQHAHAGRRGEFCSWEQTRGAHRSGHHRRLLLPRVQEQPSTSGLLTPCSCPGNTCQRSQRWSILWEQTWEPQLSDEEGLAGLGYGTAVPLRPLNHTAGSLVVVCKDRQAGREGRGVRAEVFSAQVALVLCKLVLALNHQQIQLCCNLLPHRNVHQL